jgi:Flp pilus assembly protein TadD
MDQFLAALKVEPENALAHLNLANALNQQGRTAEAIGHYRVALELDAAWPEALNRLACVLATHQDARFRDGARAVRLAEKANELTDHSQPALLNTLAAAYAEAGRFDQAVATEQRALQITLASAHRGLSPQIRNCLLLYQSGRPYRAGQ